MKHINSILLAISVLMVAVCSYLFGTSDDVVLAGAALAFAGLSVWQVNVLTAPADKTGDETEITGEYEDLRKIA